MKMYTCDEVVSVVDLLEPTKEQVEKLILNCTNEKSVEILLEYKKRFIYCNKLAVNGGDISSNSLYKIDSEKPVSSCGTYLKEALDNYDGDYSKVKHALKNIEEALNTKSNLLHSLNDPDVSACFTRIISLQVPELTNYLCNQIVPKVFLECCTDLPEILLDLTLTTSDLSTLCLCSQGYFNSNAAQTLIRSQAFWFSMWTNLFSVCPQKQKQCLFLLRASVNYLSSEKLHLSIDMPMCDTKLLKWDESTLASHWEHFFVMYETLNEKQLHLVNPCLGLFNEMNSIGDAWKLCVAHKCALYPRAAVKEVGLDNMMKAPFELIEKDFIRRGFLASLNESELYAMEPELKISSLCRNLQSFLYNGKADIFVSWMKDVSWSPVPFYFLYYHVLCDFVLSWSSLDLLWGGAEKIPNIVARKAVQYDIGVKLASVEYPEDVQDSESLMALLVLRINRLSDPEQCIREFPNPMFCEPLFITREMHSMLMKGWAPQSCFYNKEPEAFGKFILLNNFYKVENIVDNIVQSMGACTDVKSCTNLARFLKGLGNTDRLRSHASLGDFTQILMYGMVDFVEADDLRSIDDVASALEGCILNGFVSEHFSLEQFREKLNMCRNSPVKKYFLLKVFEVASSHFGTNDVPHLRDVLLVLRDFPNCQGLNKLRSQYFDAYGNSLLNCYELSSEIIPLCECLEILLEICDKGMSTSIVSSAKVVSVALGSRVVVDQYVPLVSTLLEKLSRVCSALKMSENVRSAVEAVFEALLCDGIVRNEKLSELSANICAQFVDRFTNAFGFLNVFVDQFIMACKRKYICCECLYREKFFRAVWIPALFNCSLLRKDQRVEFQMLCHASYNLPSDLFENLEKHDRTMLEKNIRALVVKALLTYISQTNVHEFLEVFISEYPAHKGGRYFFNSQVHLDKVHFLQSLLLVEPYILANDVDFLMDWVVDRFLLEGHQSSVRLYLEWLLFRLITREEKDFAAEFIRLFAEKMSSQDSSRIVFLSVLNSLVEFSSTSYIKVLQYLLPLTMGPNFTVRWMSQIVAKTCLKKETGSGLDSLRKAIDLVLVKTEEGNLKKNLFMNVHKWNKDHYTLESIFRTIPKLFCMPETEELDPMCIILDLDLDNKFQLSMNTHNKQPVQYSKASFNTEANHSNVDASYKTGECAVLQNVQKKIIPSSSSGENGHLVVVASLVDRLPNLGGLCRTCEVFGAEELVISSLKYTESIEFQSLSMSAERWIKLSEIKIPALSQYLMGMKEKGYSIVGAEQTPKSVDLTNFRFSEKSLLLLGHEKTGIPANLLPLLDQCIVIPQCGQIRSLNVHVAGALCIWEYFHQHMA